MYSLVSPSVLCMDLARHDNGPALVDLVDRTLTLGPGDIPRLAAAHREDDEREAAWAEVDEVSGATPRLPDAVVALGDRFARRGLAAVTDDGLADTLARTPLFGLSHLLLMVRHDVLDWTWEQVGDVAVQRHPEAVAVVMDAVAATYARDALSVATYARLGGPWSRLHRGRPTPPLTAEELGPQGAQLRRLFGLLATLDARAFMQLAAAATAARIGGNDWPTLMHGASWAAYLTGRLRAVARAQLAATRSVLAAGITPVQAAAGVMRAVTAVVQALVVADLLDEESYEALTGPFAAGHGSPL